MTPRRWRAAAAVLAGSMAFASPASAEPVKAGPAVPDELAVMAVGGALPTPASYRTDQLALHRIATADGGYRGRIVFPASGDTPFTKSTQAAGGQLRNGTISRSEDGSAIVFTAVKAVSGLNYQDSSRSTVIRVGADGTYTDRPLGTGYMSTIGSEVNSVATIDHSRYWLATTTAKPLASIGAADTAMTQISGRPLDGNGINRVAIVDGSLYTTSAIGVTRLTGLPTALDTVTTPQPVINLSGAFDSAFLDTDGVAGADTAYLTRGTRGLWKFALTDGTWVARGRVAGNFAFVTARAVAGAVEIYATDPQNRRVLKVVDTAEIGATLTATGATTIAYAPNGTRYAGLSFAPGTGLPSDPAPYPATPPALVASTSSLQTHVGATPKASLTVDVSDPNTPAGDLTISTSSANPTVLPNDRVTVSGTGTLRTLTFDPVAAGQSTVTITVKAGEEQTSLNVSVTATGEAPDATSHYYSGAVDLSAAIDVGGDYFLSVSDEVNNILLYKKGVSGAPITSWNSGFPGGETDFEGATRFGNTIVWSGSHGNNRSGSARPERRFLAFQTITGSGDGVDLEWSHSYTRLWEQWKTWDATNGHGLGANKLKFNTATVPGLLPNAPFGFNVEGLTMAPGSSTTAWFGMRAPTITGDDGIERALILPVTNIDKLTSDAVNAQFGAPILLDLGGRSIRDINKNANDQYLISAGTGDTDDSLKNWALYTWDGNPSSQPQMVKELPTDESRIGAWEGIAEVPANLTAGSRVLMTADSGDTGLGKSYGQYVTIGEPIAGPAVVGGVTATAKPGAIDIAWEPAARADRYYVAVKDAAGQHVTGSPFFSTGTSQYVENLTAGAEYTITVRAQNVATRSAAPVAVKATPTVGARVPTTTTIEFVGSRRADAPLKLIATLSDPAATGTIQFFNNTTQLQDATAVEPVPGGGGNQYRRTFPVVNGKAEIDLTGRVSAGLLNLTARFTTTNPENYLSSISAPLPVFLEAKPRVPHVEVVSVTGALVEGQPTYIKIKLNGYLPGELYPGQLFPLDLFSRVNGSLNKVVIPAVITPENPYGQARMDPDKDELIVTTTAMVAGKHRIGVYAPNFNSGYVAANATEIPVEILPAGSATPQPPAVKRPTVHLTVAGSRLTTGPITLTARVSDPALAGTVQFFHSSGTNIGTPVPVANGIATYTGTIPGALPAVFARFEPAADRDTTASAVSLAVPVMRAATELPFAPATKTATTLAVAGEPVVGAPRVANVTVAARSDDPFDARNVNGYVELLNGERSLGLAHVIAGKAAFDLAALPAGVHTLTARYVTSDPIRSESSASTPQTVTVVVETETEAPVGGSVPATLALSLGAPAGFQAFTPGLARDYTASTTATVISTAGDATLTVADPSAAHTGHLVNGTFALAQPLRVATQPLTAPVAVKTWSAPTSNEAVAIDFTQSIGANDALRTGTYAKALTFTLSTTTP